MKTTAPAWTGGARLILWGAVSSVVGVIAWCAGLVVDARQALFSLLTAYAFLMSVLLGALILLMATHAARSEWPVAARRLIEAVTGAMPLLALFFVPIALGAGHIYVWAGAEPADAAMREVIAHKAGYFSVPFFVARAVVYLLSWVIPAQLLRGWSLAQDFDGDPRWNYRQWALSGVSLVMLSLTLTFASIDWFMSLTPDWKSSIYGIYFFAGGFLSAFSLLIVLMTAGQRDPSVAGAIHAGHYLSTGKYMLAFTIFWTYAAFDQFFIIWIANIPAEASWWVPRMAGWGGVSIALIFLQFVIPFFFLLSRDLKRKPKQMTALAVWILVSHYLDMYWLIAPALHKDGPHPSWMDAAALLLVLGASLACAVWRAQGYPLVAAADPRFPVSVAYEGS
jgi:hypothetical protein